MPTQLQQSVGAGGANLPADVKGVQGLLNQQAAALQIAALVVNGQADAATVAAIRQFQTQVLHMPSADGRIDPGGRTWRELSGADALSGAAWWQANQARFPNSDSVDTLDAAFKQPEQGSFQRLAFFGWETRCNPRQAMRQEQQPQR